MVWDIASTESCHRLVALRWDHVNDSHEPPEGLRRADRTAAAEPPAAPSMATSSGPGHGLAHATLWWAIGLALGLGLVGPAWSGDALLNLDLVVFDDLDVSTGLFGLGPELPRQSPLLAVVGALAGPLDGTSLVALVMIACVASAFVGVVRLVADGHWAARLASGLLYAWSPWLATRLAVGHLGLAVAAALLPWCVGSFLHPGRDLRRLLQWSIVIGLTGYFGASLALVAIVIGLVADRWSSGWRVVGCFAVGQLPWLVPGLVVAAQSPAPGGSEFFRTDVEGLGDLARVVLGHGFWQRGNQIGDAGTVVALAGVAVVTLAIAGFVSAGTGDRRDVRLPVLGLIGLALALSGSIPLLRSVVEAATSVTVGGFLREPQRFLVLWLLWLAVTVAAGLAALSGAMRSAGRVAALGVALVPVSTLGGELWGIGDRLDPVDLPAGWSDARALVGHDVALALPWFQYLDVPVADDRRVYHPVTRLLAGDVVNSADPGFGTRRIEASDPRRHRVDEGLGALARGEPIGPFLADAGIDWIVLVVRAGDDLVGLLERDPSLRVAASHDTIAVFEVADPGTGTAGRFRRPVPFVGTRSADPEGSGIASTTGWMSGWRSAVGNDGGALIDQGTVWYWPAVVVLVVDLSVVGVAFAAFRPRRRDDDDPNDDLDGVSGLDDSVVDDCVTGGDEVSSPRSS